MGELNLDDLTDEEFITSVKNAGLEKPLQKYTDRKVSEGLSTRETNLKKEYDDKIQILTEENNKLKQSAGKKDQDDLKVKMLKEAGLSEGMIKYITAEKEDDIKSQIEDLKNNIQEAQQKEINNNLEGNERPVAGDTNQSSTLENIAKDYAKQVSFKEE